MNTLIMETTTIKSSVERAIIAKLQEERNPEKIKAQHVLGFDTPIKLKTQGDQEISHIPDIEVNYENETHLYDIVLDKKEATGRWKLLSQYARKNNGNLYLVVPEKIKDAIKKSISENDINAGILFFQL
jgi:hypothetical protein